MSLDMDNPLIYLVVFMILLIVGIIVNSYKKKDDIDTDFMIRELYNMHNDKTEDGVYKWHVTHDMRKLPKQLEKAKQEIIKTIKKEDDDE